MNRIFTKAAELLIKCFGLSGNAEIIKKQALLNPADKGCKKAEKYRVEKLSQVLMVLFFGVVLSLLSTIVSMNRESDVENFFISRNGYGEGEKTVELIADVGDRKIREPIEVTVGERQYTKEETEKIFDEIGESLPLRILNENSSLDHVEYDLDLMESVPEYPVMIEWTVDDYDVIDSSGEIEESFSDERGVPVVLTASLSYLGRLAVYEFPAVIYPRHKEAAGKLRDIVIKKIKKYDALTVSGDKLILPHNIGDSSISFRHSGGATGAFILTVSFIMAAAVWYGRDRDLNKLIKQREKEMLTDYPDIVSRLSLFFFAGMTIRGAFEKIALDYEEKLKAGRVEKRFAYEEMLVALREMNGGVPEFQAYQNFGARSGVRRYAKLGTLLSQNLQKGNAGLTESLESEARDAFEDRKANARKAGEEAGSKLLFPMGIMLLTVMIMVIMPAFLSFSF